MAESQEINVRVAVRVRPLLPKEMLEGDEMCVKLVSNTPQLILGKDRAFTFDHVIGTKHMQDELYNTCVQSLVNGIFEGYNATVFAYGQTGSGKTYTMGSGNISSITEEEYGIIPRSLQAMFDMMKTTSQVAFLVKVSYIEIYKEELQDLLDMEMPAKELHVREDDKGNTVIVGAREIECENLDDVMSLLESGSAMRHTGSTQMNEHSSRSHSIFTVVVGQEWTEEDVLASKRKQSESSDILDDEISHYMSGKFHFVDLAGSERAHRTGNVGDRFKESVHINSGLLALGNVISALGDPKKKAQHIPYRESKITRLLKDSLGGNANTLMICCISPSLSSFDESLNSLKYANRARNIKNKPIVNRDVQSIRFQEMQSEIKALREELARQRTSLLSAGPGDVQSEQAVQVKGLEDKVIRLQTECAHYKMIAEEAYKQLIQIQEKDMLSRSQNVRLKDWLDLMEEIKSRVPSTLTREEHESQTIRDLEHELRRCRGDLKSDEEIFAEKTREVNLLTEEIESLNCLLGEREDKLVTADNLQKIQEQQLIDQQMKIEELQKALREKMLSSTSTIDDEAVTASAPPISGQRPKSVPVQLHRTLTSAHSYLRPPSRNIKTSPALFTLDRVMKSFRARSQLLISRLEDHDEVLRQTFSEDSNTGSSDEEKKFERRGTFKVKKGPKVREENKENLPVAENEDLPEIKVNSSGYRNNSILHDPGQITDSKHLSGVQGNRGSLEIRKRIKDTQLKMGEANQKMRDLAINIRLKEQLIRELVKTGKDAELMNRQNADRIKGLEKEREDVKYELSATQQVLQELEAREQQETVDKDKLQIEYKKKIETAKAKISALHKKQKETEKMVNFSVQNSKKIQDMELAVERMKQQQDNTQKRLKDEVERKAKFEREMQKEQQRVKELEQKNEQQQKILKRKNEEIAAAQRKLRSGSLPPLAVGGQEKIDDQKKWLDNEIEKILEQRRQMEELQEDLKKREEIVMKKEMMLAQKSELEIRKLRSSQIINKSLVTVSSKLQTVEQRIEDKSKELLRVSQERHGQTKDEMDKLRTSREKLQNQRCTLEDRIQRGTLLSEEEERRLIELDEAIDALDAAIEYRSDVIRSRQLELRHSQNVAHGEDNLLNRMNSLTGAETKSLLSKYFEKVIMLREKERKLNLHTGEMEVKVDEQERLIRELENALQRTGVETDRRLTKLQREYEQKIQLLMHQLANNDDTNLTTNVTSAEIKIQQLEKDLYYYKKTSRDLKKKFKELISSGALNMQGEELNLPSSVHSSIADQEPSLPNIYAHAHREREPVPHAPSTDPPHGSRPNSARSAAYSSLRITPVKISRKDLRVMSEEEVLLRRSNLKQVPSPPPQKDSLDVSRSNNSDLSNPWG